MTNTTLYQRPVEFLQTLLRFNTINPPGNEAECVQYINTILVEMGIETTLLEKAPGRPSLIARIKGNGSAPPFLLQGHVDVVPTAGQDWAHDPFGGDIHDGFIWGRGTLDMKGGVVMMLCAFMQAHAENANLNGDVIMCVLSDEEQGGGLGAEFLVEEHPEQFADVKHAIGELGGFTVYIGDQHFYPIMVAEKQFCGVQATVRGLGGHASVPQRGGAMAKLGHLLQVLDKQDFPMHLTPVAQRMIETISAGLHEPMKSLLLQTMDAEKSDAALAHLGQLGGAIRAILHNTASPTIVQGGVKRNVHPSKLELQIDCRLIPGQTWDSFHQELQDAVGDGVEFETVQYAPSTSTVDLSYYDTLADIMREADPAGVPFPYLMSATTDGRLFARLGIQTYGFLPMKLPANIDFMNTIHAADERIPVEAMQFGTDAIYQALVRYTG